MRQMALARKNKSEILVLFLKRRFSFIEEKQALALWVLQSVERVSVYIRDTTTFVAPIACLSYVLLVSLYFSFVRSQILLPVIGSARTISK